MRLDHFRKRRDLLRGRLAEFEQSIEAEHGAFGGKRASLEEVQAALAPDTALVGWVDVRTRNRGVSLHWACLVGAQGDPTWVRVPGSGPEGAWTEPDERRTDQLRAACSARARCGGLAVGHAGRRAAAGAAQAGAQPLPPADRAAVDRPGGHPRGRLARGLAQRATPTPVVAHAPSATLFAQLAKEGADRPRTTKLLAVGDPLYD